jgi:ElaB/YqjD/DUF883 family membrane-anchored ribosome-binding protein
MSPADKPTQDKAVDADPTPAEIRQEIEETRAAMGDTVETLAEKTDVKAQAKAKVDDLKSQAQAKTDEAKAKAKDLGDKAKEAAPESPQEGVQQAQALVKENPKPAAIAAGVFVLFLLWRLLRS